MPSFRPVNAVLACCAFLCVCANAADTTAVVHIEIAKLRNARGDVGCLLFGTRDGFPESVAKAYRVLHVPIAGDRAVCDFKDVAPGTYAAVVIHDENLNGKMDKNLFGVPQEGYAASNNVRHLLSSPEFEEASFAVSAGAVSSLKLDVGY